MVRQFPALFFKISVFNYSIVLLETIFHHLTGNYFYFRIFVNEFFFFQKKCTLGKLYLLKTIANQVLQLGLHCCISALTGKLASVYAKEYPDYRVNTVHSNYFLPIGKADENNSINWNLADVHVILVDEVRSSFVSRIYSPIKKPF